MKQVGYVPLLGQYVSAVTKLYRMGRLHRTTQAADCSGYNQTEIKETSHQIPTIEEARYFVCIHVFLG